MWCVMARTISAVAVLQIASMLASTLYIMQLRTASVGVMMTVTVITSVYYVCICPGDGV